MRLGHIKIEVRQYADGRWGFDDYSLCGRRKVRVLTKQKALSRATDITVFLANGRNDLLSIDRAELAEFNGYSSSNGSPRSSGAGTR